MTTSLTIYGFGLRGNSANESIGKHRFRTKKHQKVNKSSQKTMAYLFGYWRPRVRVPPLRPKKRTAPCEWFSFLSKRCYDSNLSCVARCEFAYPTRRSESLLSRRRGRIYSPLAKIPPHDSIAASSQAGDVPVCAHLEDF